MKNVKLKNMREYGSCGIAYRKDGILNQYLYRNFFFLEPFHYISELEYLRRDSTDNYKKKRGSGTEKDNPKRNFPNDGKYRWTKGRVDGDCIYGHQGCDYDNTDLNYYYEITYDGGTGDKAWMLEKDRNYLARLYLMGTNNETEKEDLFENNKPYENDKPAENVAKQVLDLKSEELSDALRDFLTENKRKEMKEKIQEVEKKRQQDQEAWQKESDKMRQKELPKMLNKLHAQQDLKDWKERQKLEKWEENWKEKEKFKRECRTQWKEDKKKKKEDEKNEHRPNYSSSSLSTFGTFGSGEQRKNKRENKNKTRHPKNYNNS